MDIAHAAPMSPLLLTPRFRTDYSASIMPEFARSAMCLLEGIFDGQVVNIMIVFTAMT